MKKLFLLLVFSLFVFGKTSIFKLSEFYPKSSFLRGSTGIATLTIPFPDRIMAKKVMIHIEYVPSKGLVKQRSVLSLMFNGTVLYQQQLDKKIDLYSYDVPIPLYLIKDINKLKIRVSQHYCMNCCENPNSSELWTEVLWKKSYIKIDYADKIINNNLLSYRDYVLDYKNFSPVNIGIITQTKDNEFLTMGARIAGYLGSVIKYRKLYIQDVKNIKKNMDIFLIGNENFVRTFLHIKKTKIPNIFIMRNPYYPNRAIIVLTAKDEYKLKDMIDSFISIPKNLLMGKSIAVEKYKKPIITAYESPIYVPLGKKIYLSDLGYSDLKFYKPSYQYHINFNIPPDVFLLSQKKFIFNVYYNYDAAVEKASAINIYVNGKFLTALEVKHNYGTLLENDKLRVPVYLLKPGKNTITIQYALRAPGANYCQSSNGALLEGTVFATKSYIELPKFSHWREMAYMQLFTTTAYPFSIYPDLSDTQIYLSVKTSNTISAMYTLMAYIGEKTFVPLYNVTVVSSKGDLSENSNVIALGYGLPTEFYKNMPIVFDNNKITLRFNAFKRIENTLKNRLLGEKENKNLQTIIKLKDNLINETVFTEGESPYKMGKTFLLITSKNDADLFDSIKKMYNPKFIGNIKGDLVVVDNAKNNVYYADVGKKYYVGHLPWFEHFMFVLGFSYPMMLLIFIIVILVLIIILKLLLDLRHKMHNKKQKKIKGKKETKEKEKKEIKETKEKE